MPEDFNSIRLLFVDDEESIRLTLAVLLRKQGFDVTAVATVGDALTLINCCQYDVLLCDLNIEKPGDGFAVIGAMRYAQAHCVNLVLTAYPSFENALQAMQHQVDEFFTKPADVNTLVKSMRSKLDGRRSRLPVPFASFVSVLREKCSDILDGIRATAKTDPILSSALSSEPNEDEFAKMLEALIEYVDVGRNGLEPKALGLGAEHGRRRKAQGYDARMVAREFQLISERVCELTGSERMPAAPVGLTKDLTKFIKGLNALTNEALRPYSQAQRSRVLSKRSSK
jgi:ActR/RegA family two-component response regulator